MQGVAKQCLKQSGSLLRRLAPAAADALRAAAAACDGPAALQQRAGFAAAAAAQPANAMALIRELREKSGAPISDVKACLQSCGWQLDAAYDALRKKGLAAAAKKASRHAADGLVGLALAPRGGGAAVVEVNSETDFVGRSELFRRLVSEAARAALGLAAGGAGGGGGAAAGAPRELDAAALAAARVPSPSGYEAAAAPAAAPDAPLSEACAEVAAKVRENVRLRRGLALDAPPGGVVGGYVHMPVGLGLGRIAAAVALAPPEGQTLQQVDEAAALASEIAMHVAGLRPQYLSASDVPPEVAASERALLTEQAAGSGKAAAVVEKMVQGRLAKWAQEVCLLDQRFILDDSLTVRQLLQQRAAGLLSGGGGGGKGAALRVAGFLRVQTGEGLEPAGGSAKGFAEEVAEMAAGGGRP